MFEKRFIYLRGHDEDYSKDMKGLLMGNAERDQDLTVNENFGRPINNPSEEIELPKITDIRENISISTNSVMNRATVEQTNPINKPDSNILFGEPVNFQEEDRETNNEKVSNADSKNIKQSKAQEVDVEDVNDSNENEADKVSETALGTALAEKNIDTKEIEKRKKIYRLRKLRKRKSNDRIKTLRENPKKATLLEQKDLRDLFTAFRVSNSKGEVKYPFEGLKVSQYIGQNSRDLGFRLSILDELPRYLILAKLNIQKVTGINIDQTKLNEAKKLLSLFENNKGKKEIDDTVYQASIDNEKKLLDYKKQIGELSGTEYRREYKKLLEKSRDLNDNGIKINFSQNAFISSMLASPSLSYLGSKKENAKSVVVNKWKTFWKTRELRRGMLFSGLKNAVLFPPRYALKVPAYLLGYNFFRNRIRKKHDLSPITISSDLRKDFAKWGKGFEDYKKAPEEAKKQLEEARSFRNFDERFKDNESVIRANIEKGLPPPVSVDEKIFK